MTIVQFLLSEAAYAELQYRKATIRVRAVSNDEFAPVEYTGPVLLRKGTLSIDWMVEALNGGVVWPTEDPVLVTLEVDRVRVLIHVKRWQRHANESAFWVDIENIETYTV